MEILRRIVFDPALLGRPGIVLKTIDGVEVFYHGRSTSKHQPYTIGNYIYTNKGGFHPDNLKSSFDVFMYQDMTPQQVSFDILKVGKEGVTIKTTAGDIAEYQPHLNNSDGQYPQSFKVNGINRTYKVTGKWHSDTNRQNLDLVMYQSPKEYPAILPVEPSTSRKAIPFSPDKVGKPGIITERRDGQPIDQGSLRKRRGDAPYQYTVNGPKDWGARNIHADGRYFSGLVSPDGRLRDHPADLLQYEADAPAVNVADLVKAVGESKEAAYKKYKRIPFSYNAAKRSGVVCKTEHGSLVDELVSLSTCNKIVAVINGSSVVVTSDGSLVGSVSLIPYLQLWEEVKETVFFANIDTIMKNVGIYDTIEGAKDNVVSRVTKMQYPMSLTLKITASNGEILNAEFIKH